MSEKPAPSMQTFTLGIVIGVSLVLLGIAAWKIFTHDGSPFMPAIIGSVLAVAAIASLQAQKKR